VIRYCPHCQTERGLDEAVCEGVVDGRPCGWDLTGEPIRPDGWRPAPPPQTAQPSSSPRCPNGHDVSPGDLICAVCGASVEEAEGTPETPPAAAVTVVDGWRLERQLTSTSRVRERYIAVHEGDGRQALLTLYADGAEPDLDVYDILRTLPRDHVPEILQTGHYGDRAFEVSEDIQAGTLADLKLRPDDVATLSRVVDEVGRILRDLAEHGLRHRDLRPGSILVRSREPLDLVLSSFGSARLSDFDLDIVSPLETTRYTAPEAIAGGVAAASDWWSLGMVLLEQVTGGACFEGVNDQAFLIHVLTNGAPIPAGLAPMVDVLLRGLLTLDRRTRWAWPEVERWLAGDLPELPVSALAPATATATRTIRLAGTAFASAPTFALAAAQAPAWDEARELLVRGDLATWAEESGLDMRLQTEIRQLARLEGLSDDLRLGLALMALNPAMPLVCRGEIVTPGWLLEHPDAGYALIAGPAPDILKRKDAEPWLTRLKTRAETVRERARQLGVELNETEFEAFALSTSKSRLAALWSERRRLLPDTDHAGLIAILERRQTTEEDYILLLSADVGQFRSADAIIAEAKDAAAKAGITGFDPDAAAAWLGRPRRELLAEIDTRLQGFARCGNEPANDWADQFRLERRLPIGRALALLAVDRAEWRPPPKQAYVGTLLEFFSRKISAAVMRGPLTRMLIGKTTARIDLTELGSPRVTAASILDHLLLRTGGALRLDPAPLVADPRLDRRLRTLHSHATLYRRDTGIDGLYLGFPFLIMQEAKPVVPRIAPVLLWPIRVRPAVGERASATLEFDRDREEVRLNPAFEGLLGPEPARRWKAIADDFLGRASLSARDVMDAFDEFAQAQGQSLASLPGREIKAEAGKDQLHCAAALFHVAYSGQAVMEDLRQLKAVSPAGSALETALRVVERPIREEVTAAGEADRFFTAETDPSQERAVMEARNAPGLLVEGPPGTGKSQTIVNIVCDAIGRGKSVLIVCQKQPALDVVRKRLEKEDLRERIVMVGDVNKDRRATIQSVRTQVEALFAQPPGAYAWRAQRQQLAARIERLEGDLDAHQAALHTSDDLTGLSYRLILADLIALAGQPGPVIHTPALRSVLRDLDVSAVANLQETLGPLARFWLPAKYEESPLAALRAFGSDEGTLAAFASDLAAFVRTESQRMAINERTPRAARIDDPAPALAWADRHRATFLDMEPDARERLARWLGLLAPSADGAAAEEILAELRAIAGGTTGLASTADDESCRAVVARLDDAELQRWSRIAEELSRPATFLQRLSVRRWREDRELGAFMKASGLNLRPALLAALRDEMAVRPWRLRLAAARSRLVEPAHDLSLLRPVDLARMADALGAQVTEAWRVVGLLLQHPAAAAALDAVRVGTRESFEQFLDVMAAGCERFEARGLSLAALGELDRWFEPAWIDARRSAIASDGANSAALAQIAGAATTVGAYQRFRPRAAQLDALSRSVLRALRTEASGLERAPASDLDGLVRGILQRESRTAWKERLEAAHPALLLEADELISRAEALATADQEMRKLNRRHLKQGYDASGLRPLREWEDITRLQGVRAKRLREFLDLGAGLGLLTLRPVWLMNPDVASRLLPLKRALFDVVIFDEASQMPVEYALPSLYRSRAMIVSGDEKQMPPTSFFTSRVESDEAEAFDVDEAETDASEEGRAELTEAWNRQEIKDCPDLLQLGKATLPNTTLQIHYRSAFRELINFSNAAFYQNALNVPVRLPEAEVRRMRPIEVIRADTPYVDQTNPGEARRVVDVVAKLWAVQPEQRKSVGVVTFNRKQADVIEEELHARAERDAAFREALACERDREEDGEEMGFFVKNVENVQGDERDVIVFSSTFGRNAQNTFRRTFGVLGQLGGERRLNVAVTRAREKVILVTSMPIPQISDLIETRRPASSPRDFLQAYFEYARALSDGDFGGSAAMLGRLDEDRRHGPAHEVDIDGFQSAVAAEIERLGWRPARIADDSAFALDFAIEDPRTGLYGIGIECDAPRHALLARARARVMWRPAVLKKSIPVIHRVSSQGWLQAPRDEKARLADAVRSALSQEAAA